MGMQADEEALWSSVGRPRVSQGAQAALADPDFPDDHTITTTRAHAPHAPPPPASNSVAYSNARPSDVRSYAGATSPPPPPSGSAGYPQPLSCHTAASGTLQPLPISITPPAPVKGDWDAHKPPSPALSATAAFRPTAPSPHSQASGRLACHVHTPNEWLFQHDLLHVQLLETRVVVRGIAGNVIWAVSMVFLLARTDAYVNSRISERVALQVTDAHDACNALPGNNACTSARATLTPAAAKQS